MQRQEGTLYKAEDGEVYMRKHGMTEQLVLKIFERIISFNFFRFADGESESRCLRCNKPGHFARECSEPPTYNCYRCGKGGHAAKDCPDGPKPTCHRCDTVGHLARECHRDRKVGHIEDTGANAYCHWCEEKGHYTRLCPLREEEMRQERKDAVNKSSSNCSYN